MRALTFFDEPLPASDEPDRQPRYRHPLVHGHLNCGYDPVSGADERLKLAIVVQATNEFWS
jgi:hypothetical protein